MVNRLSALMCFYKIPIYPVCEGICSFLTSLSNSLLNIKTAIYIPPLQDYFLLIYYALYFISLYYLSIKYKFIYKKSYILLASFLLFYSLPIKNTISSSVSFINVGQGDCCVIRHKNDTIMIDTGGNIYQDIANDCLIPYLKKNRIYNIDILITTHDDMDHSGASKDLMKYFRVTKYISSPSAFPFTYSNIEFKNYNDWVNTSSEDNDKSLVIGFSLLNKAFLITGDAPSSIENKIMEKYSNIKCDILKVGHHGSDTSTSDNFIKYLKPKEGVISVGKNNYGHPSKKVIQILESNNVKIRQTNIEGTISYFAYTF